MLSSICVATITGLPAARQARVSRFWIGGTCWTGSSTPRSPRATMMPSEASRIAAKALTAAGFSILDMIAARPSASSRASKTSLARCTKQSASQSTPSSQANSRSFLSLSRERGERQHDVGDVDALAVRDLAADHHLGHARASGEHSVTLQPDLAVVDQQRRARPRAPRKSRDAAGRRGWRRRRRCRGRSGTARPSTSIAEPGGEGAAAELRPLQVGEDRRSDGRRRPRPGGPARGAARCRRGCRGSCSAGTRRRRR